MGPLVMVAFSVSLLLTITITRSQNAAQMTCSSTKQLAYHGEKITFGCDPKGNATNAKNWTMVVTFYHKPTQAVDLLSPVEWNGMQYDPVGSKQAQPRIIYTAMPSNADSGLGEYDLHGLDEKHYGFEPTEDSSFPLTILKPTALDEGLYEWVLSTPFVESNTNKTKRRTEAIGAITLKIIKIPSGISVIAHPMVYGQRYRATCILENFFPPGSGRMTWVVDDSTNLPINSVRTYSTAKSEEDTVSLIGSFLLGSSIDSMPPEITCKAIWNGEGETRTFNASAVPVVYSKPNVILTFESGHAVCNARCVADTAAVGIKWMVGRELKENIWKDGMVEVVGQCIDHPGTVNIRPRYPLEYTGTVTQYTCRVEGYPEELPIFEDAALYDSSPYSEGKPMIMIIVTVLTAGILTGGIILIMAVCFYYSRDKADNII
uniref:Glycoprotein C n=2 Tax=anatid alphaherpesvirus 1 TaxID=104388 RepID=A6YRK4_9ALPH|nr:glycoprotein C [Anatid alphaherpesvirus 1]